MLFFFILKLFIGVKLIYSFVLVSAVLQSELVIHISTIFRFFPPICDYRVPSRLPCAVLVLISYLFYI